LIVFVCMMAIVNVASAVIIRGIDIDFVTIGNAGNAADTGGTPGCGAVSYGYRIGKYEVTNAQWNTFTAAAGAPTGNGYGYDYSAWFTGAQQPTNNVSWYEAAQFCNYLTSGQKYSGAYQFDQSGNFLGIDRVSSISTYGTTYVIPTENEWYKAAYFKPNGSGYSLYANGLNTIPAADNGWNYFGGLYGDPWDVGTGTQEQNGTFDMMGNIYEWDEALFGSVRVIRGGTYLHSLDYNLKSSSFGSYEPSEASSFIGFRVASVDVVPEPASAILIGVGCLFVRLKRR
jgi:formylglycine-generating enzyme